MVDSVELRAIRREGMEKWSRLLRDKLDFSTARLSVPEGKDDEQFSGSIFIDKMNNDILKAVVASTAQKVSLSHKDVTDHKKSKLFIINSCNGLLISNREHRKIISAGDSIIIPSWENFTEESFLNRNSVSVILDISTITDSPVEKVTDIIWAKVSELNYGVEINKLMCNYISCYDDRFCEKNTNALLSLLALELEYRKKSRHINNPVPNGKLALIIDFIKNKIRNPDLSLSVVAEYLNISERMVQYVLSEAGIRFNELVSKERCDILANKIKINSSGNINPDIFESGFRTFSTASRQFQKYYNVTPRQYWQKLQKYNKQNT